MVAQWLERLTGDQKVAGSIPVWGSQTFFWVCDTAWVANSLLQSKILRTTFCYELTKRDRWFRFISPSWGQWRAAGCGWLWVLFLQGRISGIGNKWWRTVVHLPGRFTHRGFFDTDLVACVVTTCSFIQIENILKSVFPLYNKYDWRWCWRRLWWWKWW